MKQPFYSIVAMKAIVFMTAFVLLMVFQIAPHRAHAAPVPLQQTNSLEVSDQPLVNNTITISKVSASQDGWVAVFLDEGGRPGKLLGQTAIKQGNATNVKVQLDETLVANSKVWPRFHIDSGKIGTFEFPGADSPGRDANGSVVAKQITITGTSASPSTNQSPATLPGTGGSELSGGFLIVAGILFTIGTLLRRRTSYYK